MRGGYLSTRRPCARATRPSRGCCGDCAHFKIAGQHNVGAVNQIPPTSRSDRTASDEEGAVGEPAFKSLPEIDHFDIIDVWNGSAGTTKPQEFHLTTRCAKHRTRCVTAGSDKSWTKYVIRIVATSLWRYQCPSAADFRENSELRLIGYRPGGSFRHASATKVIIVPANR